MDSFEVIISIVVELSEAVLLRYSNAHCETGPEQFTDRVSILAARRRGKKEAKITRGMYILGKREEILLSLV